MKHVSEKNRKEDIQTDNQEGAVTVNQQRNILIYIEV
jgi:hypothetical protein